MTHCTVDSLMWRSVWIDGIATLTIATSRIVMKNAAPTTARTSHLFLCSSIMLLGNEARRTSIPSVAEMPAPGKDHSRSCTIDGRGNLGVAFGAAGLDDRRDAARQRLLRPVGEGEEGIGRERRSFEVVFEPLRFVQGDPYRINAALLPTADPDRLQVLRDHDRIRPDVLGDAPREHDIAPLLLGQRSGDDVHRLALVDVPIAVLHEEPTGDALVVELVRGERAPLAVDEDPRGRLR